MVMPQDDQYVVEIAHSYLPDKEELRFGHDGGTVLWAKDVPFPIVKGDRVRLYGKGFGYQIRGVAVEGKGVIRYQTEEQMREENRLQSIRADEKKQQELEATRADRDARRAALPPAFRARLDRFSQKENWRRDHESYELFVCEEAVKMVEHFKTSERLVYWNNLSWEEQKEQFPDVSDDHSGNTFGAAVNLANLYMTVTPDYIVKQHGALCPLVGCEEYGCWVTTKEPVVIS